MSRRARLSRRTTMKFAAAATALPLVHIRSGRAAGKLSVGFWDHWVPQGSEVLRKQCEAWAEKNQVEIKVDFITSVGNKLLLTQAAEAQAGAGHDVLHFSQWEIHHHADRFEPVDDVVQRLVAKYGNLTALSEFLAKINDHWLAVPTSWASQAKPPCARISVLKSAAGIDVTKMYPVRAEYIPEMDEWTWDTHLKAAEACHKAGMPFGIGLGTTPDSSDTAGALFAAFGAVLVDAKGNVTVDSDPVRQVLEHAERLVKVLPPDAVSWDDASNNRALISGKAALIWNPPSAWAVAKRDAPAVAADCWTFSAPKGPNGRFVPFSQAFWGIWKFAQNKTAAKELLEHLMQREQVDPREVAAVGYDIPPYAGMLDFKVWEDVEPPKGTVFNYPVRPSHHGEPSTPGLPAPPDVAVQIYQRGIYPTMLAKLQSGQSSKQVIAWSKDELEGFIR
jgi:ABC-type glycerol-3-phosphate transport system substrate-binding protein